MIKQRSKIYRQKNIEKLSTKYNCECGGKYTYETKRKHIKSTKHIEWQNEQKVGEVVDVQTFGVNGMKSSQSRENLTSS